MGSPPVIPNGEGAMLLWTQIEKNNRRCVCGVSVTEGDYLLLKHGRQDFVCQVQGYDERTGTVRFQYLNTRDKDDRKNHSKLQLAWMNSDNHELYVSKLTPKMVADG